MDRAGNAAESSLHFFVDSTAPVVSLLSPAAGSFLPTSAGTVAVEGRLVETNLDSYALELGAGTAPSVFIPLASGASLDSPDIALDWDVSALPDGVYTLRLRATDKAGTTAETSRSLVLDGTPPTVAFEEPLDGAFVDRSARVVGTATDENFAEAVLGISGSGAPAQNLVRFESPVLDGILHEGLPLQDGSYRLSLVARDRAGNETTVERSIIIDTVPPEAPRELRAAVEDKADVRLTWLSNGESDLAGYLVYRDGTLLTEEPIPTPGYLDGSRPEGRFRYTVVAVDHAGHASDPSPAVEARVDLTPPTVVLRSPDDGARVRGLVDIVGTAFAETDFKEYRVSVAPEATPLSPTRLKTSPLPVTFATLVQWEAVALDGAYVLTLEGEDTSGNVATDRVRVVVDNDAPEPPTLTSVAATAAPEDVAIEWQPSPSTDVTGYLVYRNGTIANAPGSVSGDLRPFLVPGPSTIRRPASRWALLLPDCRDGRRGKSRDPNRTSSVSFSTITRQRRSSSSPRPAPASTLLDPYAPPLRTTTSHPSSFSIRRRVPRGGLISVSTPTSPSSSHGTSPVFRSATTSCVPSRPMPAGARTRGPLRSPSFSATRRGLLRRRICERPWTGTPSLSRGTP